MEKFVRSFDYSVTVPTALSVGTSPPPTANLSGTPRSGDAPLTVAFTDTSVNSPTGWVWDFGDGSGSTDQNPSHTYTTPGTYDVSLTASNAVGFSSVTDVGYEVIGDATLTHYFIPSFFGRTFFAGLAT